MHILLAHDGSDGAAQAAQLVGSIPWPAGSTVRVVSAIEPTMVALTAWAGVTEPSADLDDLVTGYYEGELDAVVRRLESPGRHVEGAVLRGRPATAIVDDARAFGADVVAVGSRGHGAIASLVLGSVSSEIVDYASCPVLVARRPTLSRVVLATDASPSALVAQELVSTWPIFQDVPIRVVSVADVPHPWHTGIAPTMYARVLGAYTRDLADATEAHRQIAAASVAALRAAGREATANPLAGDAAASIIAAGVDADADLIVLGSRGRTGLTRLLLGSVARNVVHGSSASILVVHDDRP